MLKLSFGINIIKLGHFSPQFIVHRAYANCTWQLLSAALLQNYNPKHLIHALQLLKEFIIASINRDMQITTIY